MNIDNILKQADNYYNQCIIKSAKIRKLPNGKYRVLSKKDRNLGTYNSKEQAKKRLQQVEYFKHMDADDQDTENKIDLSDIDDFSYSAILRKLKKQCDKKIVYEFMSIYKKYFDQAYKNNEEKDIDKIVLQKTLLKFNKIHSVKLDNELVKKAALTELGNPQLVVKYLSDIIKFTLNRIKPENRQKAINGLKYKIYNLNENEISNKNLPASSAIGQSITFVKHVLFNSSPRYIREILNNIVRNL